LPNAVPIGASYNPYDFGFTASAAAAPAGTTAAADGYTWRQPADGARIEIVGTTQGLWFYRGDINAWTPAVALTIDSELPINGRAGGTKTIPISIPTGATLAAPYTWIAYDNAIPASGPGVAIVLTIPAAAGRTNCAGTLQGFYL